MAKRIRPWTPAIVALSLGLLALSLIRPHRPPTPAQTQIAIVPLGHPSRKTLDRVEAALRQTYNIKTVELKGTALPKDAFYKPRNRYRAEKLTVYLSQWPDWKVMGVTDKDISTTVHGFQDFGIMGRADLGGKACVVSSFRSHAAVGNVAIHELGHTLGLPHCKNPNCIMVDANGSGKITEPSRKFCPSCALTIRQWLKGQY